MRSAMGVLDPHGGVSSVMPSTRTTVKVTSTWITLRTSTSPTPSGFHQMNKILLYGLLLVLTSACHNLSTPRVTVESATVSKGERAVLYRDKHDVLLTIIAGHKIEEITYQAGAPLSSDKFIGLPQSPESRSTLRGQTVQAIYLALNRKMNCGPYKVQRRIALELGYYQTNSISAHCTRAAIVNSHKRLKYDWQSKNDGHVFYILIH